MIELRKTGRDSFAKYSWPELRIHYPSASHCRDYSEGNLSGMQIAEYITESIRLEQEYIWEVIASRQQRKGRVRGCRVQEEEGVMVRAHTPGSKPRSTPAANPSRALPPTLTEGPSELQSIQHSAAAAPKDKTVTHLKSCIFIPPRPALCVS